MNTCIDITAEDMLKGQDPKSLVFCFFKDFKRVKITGLAINGAPYRNGRLLSKEELCA